MLLVLFDSLSKTLRIIYASPVTLKNRKKTRSDLFQAADLSVTGWRLIKACKRNSNNFLLFSIPHRRIFPILQAQAHPLSQIFGEYYAYYKWWLYLVWEHDRAEYGNTCLSAVLAFGSLRQELQELKASLGYLLRPCLRKQNTWQCTYPIFPWRIIERRFGDKCCEFWSLLKASVYLLWSWE